MLHMLRLIVCFFMISWLFAGYSRSEETAVPEIGKDIPGVDTEKMQQDINKVLNDVQKNISGSKPLLPTQEQNEQGEKEAKQAVENFNSTENQKKLQDEKERVQKENTPADTPLIQPQSQQSSSKETVYIFLSSSVPDVTVHAYLTQAALYSGSGIVPVFFGLTNGVKDKRAAGRYFGHVMQENLECVDLQGQRCPRMKVRIAVNSTLFTQYSITQVPTVVYTNGEDSWTLGGDSALDFMLTRIDGEARSPFLEGLIKRLRGTH